MRNPVPAEAMPASDEAITEHEPDRLTYLCQNCGDPWPCVPARTRLAATHNRVDLGIRMWNELEAAIPVLRFSSPAVLWNRFLRWAE